MASHYITHQGASPVSIDIISWSTSINSFSVSSALHWRMALFVTGSLRGGWVDPFGVMLLGAEVLAAYRPPLLNSLGGLDW